MTDALRQRIAGKRVLYLSTRRNYCKETVDILKDIRRCALSCDMMEHSSRSAFLRMALLWLELFFIKISRYDIILYSGSVALTRHPRLQGMETAEVR